MTRSPDDPITRWLHPARLNQDGELLSHSLRIDQSIDEPLFLFFGAELKDPRYGEIEPLPFDSVRRQTLGFPRALQVIPVHVRCQVDFSRTRERISAAESSEMNRECAGAASERLIEDGR